MKIYQVTQTTLYPFLVNLENSTEPIAPKPINEMESFCFTN